MLDALRKPQGRSGREGSSRRLAKEEGVNQGHRRRVFVSAFVFVLAACLAAPPSTAQILYGSVVGVVKDAQGATVPGASVTITNKDTNLTRETVANAVGAFTIVNVPAGRYDIKFSLTGFRDSVRTNVPVSIGEISRVDRSEER